MTLSRVKVVCKKSLVLPLMKIHVLLIVVGIQCLCVNRVAGQRINSPEPFFNYYYDYKIANPAFTAFEDQLRINLSYSGFPYAEENWVKQGSTYFSYESQVDTNSGFGMFFKSERFITEPFQAVAAFYRYKFQVGDQWNARIGTQVSYFRLVADRPYIKDREIYNLDLGFVLDSRWITIGGSIKNLLQPSDFSYSYMSKWKDRPDINFIATRKFTISNAITATPSLFFRANEFGEGLTINGVFEIKKLILLGGSYGIDVDDLDFGNEGYSFNAGITVKDRVQFIVHLYSNFHGENREYYSGERRYYEGMLIFKIPDGGTE